MSEYRVRPNVDEIPCPFLAAAYNNGDLAPDPDGTVHRRDIESALATVGLAKGARSKLARAVLEAVDAPDTLNLFELRGSKIDHTGSTGIRDPEVDPTKLPVLLAFGENGRMYRTHFARAASQFGREDPGTKGSLAVTVEFEGLWLHGRYPDGWRPRPADSITAADFMRSAAKSVVARVWHRIKGRLR